MGEQAEDDQRTLDLRATDRLIRVLSETNFVSSYIAFCEPYRFMPGSRSGRLDLSRLVELFKLQTSPVISNKRLRIIDFGHEEIGQSVWHGSLVIQKHDMFEPCIVAIGNRGSIGASMVRLAMSSGALHLPPILLQAPLPRPAFDGDMHTMERMVPDLVGLFEHVKQTLRQHWP